jgi:hypothetical protein
VRTAGGHEFSDLCTHAVANDDNRPRRPALERIKHGEDVVAVGPRCNATALAPDSFAAVTTESASAAFEREVMTRSTPFSARCSAVLRPRPRLAPVTSAILGCVDMRDFPSSICGALRVPNDTIRYTVLTHHDAGGGWPAEGIVCPGLGDPCRSMYSRCAKRLCQQREAVDVDVADRDPCTAAQGGREASPMPRAPPVLATTFPLTAGARLTPDRVR